MASPRCGAGARLAGQPATGCLVDGRRRRLWLLFAGNCCYAPRGFAPSYRPDLSDGQLDVRVIDAKPPLARVRLLAAVLTGTLGRSRVYRSWSAESLEIAAVNGSSILVSGDGEVTATDKHIRVAKRPGRLLVYRTPEVDSSTGRKSH